MCNCGQWNLVCNHRDTDNMNCCESELKLKRQLADLLWRGQRPEAVWCWPVWTEWSLRLWSCGSDCSRHTAICILKNNASLYSRLPTWNLTGAFAVTLIPFSLKFPGTEYRPTQSEILGSGTLTHLTSTHSPEWSSSLVFTVRDVFSVTGESLTLLSWSWLK